MTDYETIDKGKRLERIITIIDGDRYEYYTNLCQFEIGDNWGVYFSPTLSLPELVELKAFIDYLFKEVIE